MTSREFNQDLAQAKRAAKIRPVIITDRGRPAHVLLSITEYRRLTERQPSIAELLRDDESADIELPLPEKIDAKDWVRIPDLEA